MTFGILAKTLPPTCSSGGVIRFESQFGHNSTALADDIKDEISDGLRKAIIAAAHALQADLRRQVSASGLGPGLENAWQSEVYPKTPKQTFHPAALVYSKSVVLHYAFDVGPVIMPDKRKFLVIPTVAGIRLGLGTTRRARGGGTVPFGKTRNAVELKWLTPNIQSVTAGRGAPSRKSRSQAGRYAAFPVIRLLPSRKTGGMVAAYYANETAKPVIVAILVRAVKLPKLLNIEAARQRAEAVLSSAVGA